MAHLHAILATASSGAILLKRGPGSQTRTIGWDRRKDTFTKGQCVRREIEYYFTDLSPDGRFFLHYVHSHGQWYEHPIYRAISRAPWLKALTFWGSSSGEYGPGTALFFQERGTTRIRAHLLSSPEWDHLKIPVIPYDTETPEWRTVLHPESTFFTRLQRDGWVARTAWERCSPAEAEGEATWKKGEVPLRIVFEKLLPFGHSLHQTHWCGSHRDPNRGSSWESFAIVSPDGSRTRYPSWEWADVDPTRGRVVWAEDGVLSAATVSPAGLNAERPLLDTRAMTFERLLAPY
jgi:hypothetical protein